jgi:hypothetical protein
VIKVAGYDVTTNCYSPPDTLLLPLLLVLPPPPSVRLGELAEPYFVLKDAGYDVTIASPAGGAVPIDEASLQGDFKTPECDRMLNDGE